MCNFSEVHKLLRDVHINHYIGIDYTGNSSLAVVYAPKMGQQEVVFCVPDDSTDPYLDVLNFLKTL